MAFDNAAFIELVWKNERGITSPKTVKDIREGIDFFKLSYGGISRSSQKTLELAKERCERVLNAMGLSFDYKFPEDPVLKNKVWKEQVQPRAKELQEIFKYEKMAKGLKLPKKATREEVDELLAAVRERKRRSAAEEKKRKKEIEQKKRDAKRIGLGLNADADPDLAAQLVEVAGRALERERSSSAGYIYFKVWVMPDGTKWYKIGITNDLRRRESEQNVLPVPAHTLHSARFHSIEHAKVAERCFLSTLSRYRIKGAKNKEIFNLKPPQVQAVIGAMRALKTHTF